MVHPPVGPETRHSLHCVKPQLSAVEPAGRGSPSAARCPWGGSRSARWREPRNPEPLPVAINPPTCSSTSSRGSDYADTPNPKPQPRRCVSRLDRHSPPLGISRVIALCHGPCRSGGDEPAEVACAFIAHRCSDVVVVEGGRARNRRHRGCLGHHANVPRSQTIAWRRGGVQEDRPRCASRASRGSHQRRGASSC